MKVDLLNVVYTVSMIALALIVSVIVTKLLSKYLKLDKNMEEEEQKKTK